MTERGNIQQTFDLMFYHGGRPSNLSIEYQTFQRAGQRLPADKLHWPTTGGELSVSS